MSPTTRRTRARARGMTMIEVVVAIGILAMVGVLIHGVIDSLAKGRKGEGERADRVHQGREAMQRIVRDLSSSYISQHFPANPTLVTNKTVFVGKNSLPYDSLDFAAFTHRRTTRDAHESDQAEIGYYVAPDPDNDEKNDLVRREQTPIDLEPTKGGVREVVAEDVVEFDVRYFDPLTGQWGDVWDTTQINGQPNRMPLEVSIKIVLKGVGNGDPYTYETKVFLPMQQPLSFGIPKQ